MRLALGLALAAAAIVPATASAGTTCTPYAADARVCVTHVECFRPWSCELEDDANIDPQCTPAQPLSGACATVDDIYVPITLK
jgi:hypothetical protein